MALVITGIGGGKTVNANVAVPVVPSLLALMTALNVPVSVGVPEMRPVAVFTISPLGRLVALKLAGLLDAVIW